MGRLSKPQRSNKHKKLKFVDPFYNGKRKERMYGEHDMPPNDGHEQEKLSQKMRDLVGRIQRTKELENKTRKQRRQIISMQSRRQFSSHGEMESEVPQFIQKKGESYKGFMRRIDITVHNAIKSSQMNNKLKLPTRKYNEMLCSHNKQQNQHLIQQEHVSSQCKRKLKYRKNLKKMKKQNAINDRKDDYDDVKDEVQFGDVVHGLPHLTAHPKQPILKTNPTVQNTMLYKRNKSDRGMLDI